MTPSAIVATYPPLRSFANRTCERLPPFRKIESFEFRVVRPPRERYGALRKTASVTVSLK